MRLAMKLSTLVEFELKQTGHNWPLWAKKLTSCVLTLTLIGAPLEALAAPKTSFDIDKTRELILKLSHEKQNDTFKIEPPPPPGSPQEAFLNHYFKVIHPHLVRREKAQRTYQLYSQLIDAGLYKDQAQYEEWLRETQSAVSVITQIDTDPQWETDLIQWGKLATGLEGSVANFARHLSAMFTSYAQFPPQAQSLFAEEMNLRQEIDQVAIKSHQLPTDNKWVKGQFIADRASAQLNRSAQLKTEFAQTKGYKTNADFALEAQESAYAPQLRGKNNLRKFLNRILDLTDSTAKKFFELRALEVYGKTLGKLRSDELAQVSQVSDATLANLSHFFPAKSHVDVWRRTMIESGFSPEVMDRIIVDANPRRNKNGHAYMSPLREPQPYQPIIDGVTLNETAAEDKWNPAWIYILLNSRDGLSELETLFHEGGHALHRSYQQNLAGKSAAYGLEETHSMTMEAFLKDREFLLANGFARLAGRVTYSGPIKEKQVDMIIRDLAIRDLFMIREFAANALYDIELWDYDYVKGPQTFIDRSLKLADRLYRKLYFYEGPFITFGYSKLVTDHYRSGEVRFFGYALAAVAAALTTDTLYEKLEQTTGRRTLYKQPTLGPLLIEGLYRHGIDKPFPLSVEEFTGHKFSADEYAEHLNRRLAPILEEMERDLNPCPGLLNPTVKK